MPAIRFDTEEDFVRATKGTAPAKSFRPKPTKGVATEREKGRQQRLTLKARQKARIERETAPRFDRAKPIVIASSLKEHDAEVKAQQDIAKRRSQRRKQLIATPFRAAGSAATSLGNAKVVTNASPMPTIIVAVGAVFTLILMYLLVSHSGQTSGFLGSLVNWVASLSTTNPLFQATPTSSGSGSTPTTTSSGGTTASSPSGSTTTPTGTITNKITLADINELGQLITNLENVPVSQRTPQQSSELATYQARMVDYQRRYGLGQ